MARRPKPVHQMSAAEFERMFPDEDACCAYLVARRWPNGVKCPRCGAEKPHKLSNRAWSWQCYQCAPDTSYRFSHIAGTIFENTNKPLRDWFKVAHLMLASKKGMSALQIMRYMGFGSYKTAWGMCHKIRTALMQNIDKLGGIVEMDETFIGGKDKNRHWDKKRGYKDAKVPIIGAVQRKGNVVARVLDRMTTQAAITFVNEVCSNKVSLLATDDWPGYQGLPSRIPHGSVDHSRHQYVVGAIHTNTIEGFWSIFKRGVVGTYHKMSAKYMPFYVAEFQFRYNNRSNPDIFGTAISGS
jgi:IS1 family transposase/transposase-like protein